MGGRRGEEVESHPLTESRQGGREDRNLRQEIRGGGVEGNTCCEHALNCVTGEWGR
jgi:hypothetical protein